MIAAGDRFMWRGNELEYLVHPYNRTALNERAVEVPIGWDFIDDQLERDRLRGLEVGNVLSHYDGPVLQRVVDLYEHAEGVENIDLFDVTGSYEWIVAISTLEHVRWEVQGAGNTKWEDEPDPSGPLDGLAHLRSLLAPGGALLVTAPFCQHPYLDGAILSGGLQPTTEATLTFEGDHWDVHEGQRIWRHARELRWAGAVWVATWEAPR